MHRAVFLRYLSYLLHGVVYMCYFVFQQIFVKCKLYVIV